MSESNKVKLGSFVVLIKTAVYVLTDFNFDFEKEIINIDSLQLYDNYVSLNYSRGNPTLGEIPFMQIVPTPLQ